jgi:hypothetical protein
VTEESLCVVAAADNDTTLADNKLSIDLIIPHAWKAVVPLVTNIFHSQWMMNGGDLIAVD